MSDTQEIPFSVTFPSLEVLDDLISAVGAYNESIGFESKEMDQLERRLVNLAAKYR